MDQSVWDPPYQSLMMARIIKLKNFDYFSLIVSWIIHRPVKNTIRNGSEKSYTYFLPLHLGRSAPTNVARRIPASTPYRCMWVEFEFDSLLCSKRFFSE